MKHKFKIESKYSPTGDQPQAIKELVEGIESGVPYQTLLGVTGSGKTFTMANVIEQTESPTLILSHNKTLAAQLYAEMKAFFPNNLVEYFVSYYDYYQPEAYLPTTNTYIEKDLSINEEIEKLRLRCISSLQSGRKDIIVVSSVSCIYGTGNPEDFEKSRSTIKVGDQISRNKLLRELVDSMYSRTELEFTPGTFRVKGDSVSIFPPYAEFAYKVLFWGDEIEEIHTIDPIDGKTLDELDSIVLFPATMFVTSPDKVHAAIRMIQDDLVLQMDYFSKIGKPLEAKRLEGRVEYDIEMMKELGYCTGIENYSRYFDGRLPGTRPFCLLDFFPKNFVTMIDESHVTIPQIRAMYGGDRARKISLVEYGFRLPAARDNRPLQFDEFEEVVNQTLYVSATPADYELMKSEGVIVEQIIRPTGLLDPKIEVRPSRHQIDDLIKEINIRKGRDERVLVTTLTKRMAEELSQYLQKVGIDTAYIHSDVDTIERIEIMEALREGTFTVLVGINLLREGLDLPEVSLVAIIDADKEGFLRSERALTQTAGRAARNVDGTVIMYADTITKSMQKTIDSTNYRRAKQHQYNIDNGLTPQPIIKASREIVGQKPKPKDPNSSYTLGGKTMVVADPIIQYMNDDQLQKAIDKAKKDMDRAAKAQEFMQAAQSRDEMYKLIDIQKGRK